MHAGGISEGLDLILRHANTDRKTPHSHLIHQLICSVVQEKLFLLTILFVYCISLILNSRSLKSILDCNSIQSADVSIKNNTIIPFTSMYVKQINRLKECMSGLGHWGTLCMVK